MTPHLSFLSACKWRRGCFTILAPFFGRIASTMVFFCFGVYSPSGMTYGSFVIPSSLAVGEIDPSSFSALSDFKSGLVLMVSDCTDRFLRPLFFFPGWNGGDVRASLYSLAIANGIIAVLGAADLSEVSETSLLSRVIVNGSIVELLSCSVVWLFSPLIIVLDISTSPEEALYSPVVLSCCSDELGAADDGCSYLSAVMEDGGVVEPLSSSSSSLLLLSSPVPRPDMTGRFNPSGISASYNRPGISGASSSDIKLTKNLNGPHGVRTAHKSYSPNIINSVQVDIVSKCDNCHEMITDEQIKYPCVIYVGIPFA